MYRLRELERKDISNINEWRNNEDIISNLGAPFRYINQDIDNKWFDSYLTNRNNCVRCSIVDEEDFILGLVSLTNIDYTNLSCVFHIMIGENNQNKGAGTFAVREMLKHAFFNMNMHRVELTVLETNDRAIHLYEKCGFTKEGTKRRSTYKNGEYVNMHLYSILREEYDDLEVK